MTVPRVPRAVVLLGAQRFDPTVKAAAAELGVEGPISTVTAGWQEREGEDQELHEHLGKRTVNLRLHQRAEDVFKRDRELHAAHRAKQEQLRHKQDFYRIRLEHELDATHVIRQRKAPASILEEEERASIEAVRSLDEYHLGQCAKIEAEFTARYAPLERDSVVRHRRELAKILGASAALAIAGGHVATLLNRMRLFGLSELLDGQAVLAWSAGAMAISDRVVLFHDSPPQGPGAAEVLDRGLGLCPGVVALPQPEIRLKLEDEQRVSVMARRFAPARCFAMASGARITWSEGQFRSPSRVTRLGEDGRSSPVQPTDEDLG